MTTTTPTVSLRLESLPQTLTIVRAVLAGIAEPLTLEAELLDDLKTAVSEACNNVVMHAYADSGPMEIQLFVAEDEIRVTVDDSGPGMPPDAESAGGIGLSVVRALTEQMRSGPGPGGGTRLEMTFAGRRDGQPLFVAPDPAGPPLDWTPAATGDEVLLSVSPVTLLAPVLGRITRTLAAIAHFSLDRFSDIYLVTDSLAAHAARAAALDRVGVRLSAAERRVTLILGPFRSGTGAELEPAEGRSRSPLLLLSDELSVQADGGTETLRVVVADRR